MFIEPSDLEPFADIDEAKAEAMISDAEAMAVLTAPCLPGLLEAPEDETPAEEATRLAKLAGVKAILRGAILRWEEAGSGATSNTQLQAGPYMQAQTFTPAARKNMFWPSELEQLQKICAGDTQGKAFAVDTVNTTNPTAYLHTPWCSLRFGSDACSCGVDLTLSYPIWEIYNNPDTD